MSEWELSTAGNRTNIPKGILVHKAKGHLDGACVVAVESRYECWICGTPVPEHIFDVALLAETFFPRYDQPWLDTARADRKKADADMAKLEVMRNE